MNHTVGTRAYGNFVSDADGNLIGTAHFLKELDAFGTTTTASANALLWAGAADVVANAQIAIDQFRSGFMTEDAMNDLEAAIKKATIPAQAKVAA